VSILSQNTNNYITIMSWYIRSL